MTRRLQHHLALCCLCLVYGLASAQEEKPSDGEPRLHWASENNGDGRHFNGSTFATLKPETRTEPGAFTVSVWVNAFDLKSGDPTWGRGIARSTSDGKIGDWLLSVHRDGKVRFIHWSAAGEDKSGSHITSESVVGVDYWNHIAAVWDGKAHHIYVNGLPQKHDASTSAAGWGSGNEIGRSWTQPGYYWQGKVEDLRLYARALSSAEIVEQFQADPKSKPKPKPKPEPADDPAVTEAIDRHIQEKITAAKLTAAPPADDAEFHRRVVLDLAGRIPTATETQAFLNDESPTKRSDLIDAMLSGREMPLYWSRVLATWLMHGAAQRDEKFTSYLRRGLTQNKPWDEFVRDMLLARPNQADPNATLFLSSRANQIKEHTIGRDVGRAFFGVNLRCAQCHDHPSVNEWKQSHTYGLTAFFIRSFPATYKDKDNVTIPVIGEHATGDVEFTPVDGEKQAAKLVFLDGTVVEEPPSKDGSASTEIPAPPKDGVLKAPPPVPVFSRREALVKIALDPKRPNLKQAMINRVWKKLMGRGFVEPVDMIHANNPASHPELFRMLSDDFAEHGFDLRRTIASIMKSQAYARTSRSQADGGQTSQKPLYDVAEIKPLDEHQLGLSLAMAVGYYDDQLKVRPNATMEDLRPVAPWTRIVDQFDSDADDFEPTAEQALFLLNSDYFQQELIGKSRLANSLAEIDDPQQLTRQVYLTMLSRRPSEAEIRRLADYLASRDEQNRVAVCQEIVWALLTSAEFRFNH